METIEHLLAGDPSLLLVDDDAAFLQRLERAMARRGFDVRSAGSVAEGLAAVAEKPPAFAVVDLRLGTDSGLPCVQALHAFDPAMLIVVLTGYASISTAVEAIKLGACHYLVKPSSTDDIERAFGKELGDPDVPVERRPTSLKMREWEMIQQTLAATGFNISETARRLGMHRRTLARKLEKRPLR